MIGDGDGDVVGVGGHAISEELGEDRRAASARELEILEDEAARAFAEHEAVTVPVEGARRLLGRVVPRGERTSLVERADRDLDEAGLGPAGKHDVGLTAADDLGSLADGIRARRARRNVAHVRSFRAVLHRDLAGSHVDDHHRDQEWGDLSGVFLVDEDLVDEGLHTTDARPERDTDAGRELGRDLDAG